MVSYNVKDAAGNKAQTKSKTCLIRNSADYLARNYTTSCTIIKHYIGVQNSPYITNTSTYTSVITSSNIKNNVIIIDGQTSLLVDGYGLQDFPNHNAGNISIDGKEFYLSKVYGYNTIGSLETAYTYTFSRSN